MQLSATLTTNMHHSVSVLPLDSNARADRDGLSMLSNYIHVALNEGVRAAIEESRLKQEEQDFSSSPQQQQISDANQQQATQNSDEGTVIHEKEYRAGYLSSYAKTAIETGIHDALRVMMQISVSAPHEGHSDSLTTSHQPSTERQASGAG